MPSPISEKNIIPIHHNYFLVILFVVLVLTALSFDIALKKIHSQKSPACGDGTFYDTCSLAKPYFCDSETGKMIEKASVCGCDELLRKSGESCVSTYQTGPKEINLKYILDGKEEIINFTVYGGMANYLSGISREIYYPDTEIPQRADFKLKSINEKQQRQMLLPLVVAIQNITSDKDNQVRIAISIVQNIPYGFSEKKTSLAGKEINYSRYPYEVLYDDRGICGEKSALLSFLLIEMGYRTSFFYYAPENHEAVGIDCPVGQSVDNSGFCFIETSGPAILTDTGIEYVGGVVLKSQPQVIPVSQGASIGDDWKEYKDAELLNKIRNSYVPFESLRHNGLRNKYGLVEEYKIV